MKAFKAYDIRGIVPSDLDDNLAYLIGRAYATFLNPSSMYPCRIAVGYDARPSGKNFLVPALIKGLLDSGVDVVNIGACGTEQIYFTTFYYDLAGGIMVTASHNPPEYNGMKIVSKDATPVGSNSGLLDIQDLIKHQLFVNKRNAKYITKKILLKYGIRTPNIVPGLEEWNKMISMLPDEAFFGAEESMDIMKDYVEYLMHTFVKPSNIPPLKVVCNAGNGMAGPVVDVLESLLPCSLIKIFNNPDGNFPNGIPNPLLMKNRAATSSEVLKNGAQLGVAWDGDFDRCFFFDEKGEFVESYYIIALLMKHLSKLHEKIIVINEPRLQLCTIDTAKQLKNVTLHLSKSGHAFIKWAMRNKDALFGGEISGHYYFKDFGYCDSGMVPFLLLLQILGLANKPLSELVNDLKNLYPISGEINIQTPNPMLIVEELRTQFSSVASAINNNVYKIETDHTDGFSAKLINKYTEDVWAFNVRPSNTEPLLRLCIETKNNVDLLKVQTKTLLEMILRHGGEVVD